MSELKLDYKELVDEASDVIYVHDLEGNFLYANKAALRFSGYRKEEVRGLNIADVLSPENLKLAMKITKKQIEGKPTKQPYEIEIIKKDGTTGWLELHTKLLRKDGVPIGIQGIGRDITEKKKLEVALQQSEEKYRNLIESANDGIVTVDLQGNFTFVNRRGEEISGYKREELIGQPLSKIVCPEYLPMIFDRLKARAKGIEVEYTYEIEIFNKAGERVPLEITTNLITRDDKPIGSQVIVRDITKRKELEKALRDSEEKYRMLVENSNDAIFTIDAQGKFTFFNENVKKVIGFTSEELVGRHFLEILPPESQKKALKFFSRGMEGEAGHKYELEVYKKDGGTATVELNMSTLFKDGKPIGRLGVARDITERKKAEEAIKRLSAAVESMREYFVIADLDGNIVYVNPAVERDYGYAKEELLGKPVSIFIPSDSSSELAEEIRKATLRGGWTGEVQSITKDGRVFWVDMSTSVLKDKSGKLTNIIAIARDITARKKMEAKLEEKIKELERFNRLAVGRELKMIELKKRIRQLEKSK
jgi:PAS domain S-box-containing protein